MNSPLSPNLNEAIDFLDQVNAGFPSRVFSIDPNPKGGIEARIFKPDEPQELRAWLESGSGKRNFYFLPNLARTDLGPVKPKKKDIEWATHLYVDVDHTEPSYLEALKAHVPAPSCIIFSGGGYQAFWALETPTQDFAQAERLNKVLAANLSGDSCHSVDHIMRLPGTINVPTPNKIKKGRVPTLAYVVTS